MSYMQFQQQCNACKEVWWASFGIVGTSQIGSRAKECPHCGSVDIGTVPGTQPSVPKVEMEESVSPSELANYIVQRIAETMEGTYTESAIAEAVEMAGKYRGIRLFREYR